MSTQKKNLQKRARPQFKNRANFKHAPRNMNLIQKLTEVKKLQKQSDNKQIIDQCQYGSSCAHLRVKGQCQFLHQKKDYVYLGIQIPQNFLEDQQPIKKSKQQRKQDKIRQKAERQQRGKARLQSKQEEQIKQQKVIQNFDIKEQIVLNVLATLQGQTLSIQKLFKNLIILIQAYVKKSQYPYLVPNADQLYKTSFTFSEIRRRLLMKMKKKQQLSGIYKQFLQKESIIIKKIIKNVQKAYNQEIQQAKHSQYLSSNDFSTIEERIVFKQIQQILHSKKENLDLISYYSKFFQQQFGFPLGTEMSQNDDKLNKGDLLPLKNISMLFLSSPQILTTKDRIFFAYPLNQISQNQIKGVFELKNLLIPFKILNKEAIQKNLVVHLASTSFKSICCQIMTQNVSQFQQKMKSPGDFVFGNLTENVKKFQAFLKKYKQKMICQNKQNTIILIFVGVQTLLQKICSKDLDLVILKQERNIQEQNLYEKVYLIKQLIQILGDKVIYLDQKKLKFKKHRKQLQYIDNKLLQISKTIEQ